MDELEVLAGPVKMFDKADLFDLPGLETNSVPIASRIGAGGAFSAAVLREADDFVGVGGNHLSEEFRSAPSSNANGPHVIEACAMDDENIALALSDGRLCHADLSRSDEPLSSPARSWPDWEQWPAKHGSVKQLTFSPVDGALMTLEVLLFHLASLRILQILSISCSIVRKLVS